MSDQKTFLVVEGLLSENMEFELLRSYEVKRFPRQDRTRGPEGNFVAQLLDEDNRILLTAAPEIRFPQGCDPAASTPGEGLVQAVLPRHPAAHLFVLRAYDQIVFSEQVGKSPPEIKEFKVKTRRDQKSVTVRLDAGQVPPENIEFFVEEIGGRRFPVTPDPKNGAYRIELTAYAGRGEARVCVRASFNLRSTEVASQPFTLPKDTVYGRILEPLAGDEWPAGLPGSLMGNLFGTNGRRLSWESESVYWAIDGKGIGDTRSIAVCGPLEPGEHTVELRMGQNREKATVLDQVRFSVRPESEAQKEYVALLAEYLAAKQPV